jgi:tryptophan synthase alpha chain
MSRIKNAFANKAKIAYLTAGDGGGVEQSAAYFLALAKGGVNLLEVGIPYSDPVADGPVIQAAMERALAANTTVESSLEVVAKIRAQSEVAMILFTYYNPIQDDLAGFLTRAKQAGADGVLIVDLPYEESANYRYVCKYLGLAPINVIAPSTSKARMKTVLAGLDQGFVYYACQKGTTGTRDGLPADLPAQIAAIREASQLPVAVGFGVANSAMVEQILALADGCVVGSYLVKQLANQITPAELTTLTKDLYHVA